MLSLFTLASLTSVPAAADWVVPVLYWSMKIEGQVAMRKGLEEEIHQFNKSSAEKIVLIPYVAGEGRKGTLTQVNQFEEALNKNPRAIIVQPTDNSALAAGLLEANRKKIPVIAYDQYIVKGQLLSFLSSDNFQAGLDNGEYIDSRFGKGKPLRIVVMEYPRVSSTMDRVDGFFVALRRNKRSFKVLKRYEAVDPDSGTAAAKEFIKDFPTPGSVDVILSVNDGGGLSLIKILQEKKRTEIVHASFDGDPLSIKNIQERKNTVIDSAQFCAELGREAARDLIAHLSGKIIPNKTLIPTFPVNAVTLHLYTGWMSKPVLKKLAAPHAPQPPPQRNSSDRLILKIGVAPLCPYLCEQGPGKWGGYMFDILEDVAKKNNFILQLESIANTRLVSSLQTRKVNYIVVPSYMVRYHDDLRTVGPSLGASFIGAVVGSDKKLPLFDEGSLTGHKVVYADVGTDDKGGLFLGLNSGNFTKLSGTDAADRMVKLVGDRRMDVALGDYNVLSYSMLRKSNSNLQLLPTSLVGFSSLVLVGGSKEPEFGGLPFYLDNWFKAARKNGQLDKTLQRYNLKDWRILVRD